MPGRQEVGAMPHQVVKLAVHGSVGDLARITGVVKDLDLNILAGLLKAILGVKLPGRHMRYSSFLIFSQKQLAISVRQNDAIVAVKLCYFTQQLSNASPLVSRRDSIECVAVAEYIIDNHQTANA